MEAWIQHSWSKSYHCSTFAPHQILKLKQTRCWIPAWNPSFWRWSLDDRHPINSKVDPEVTFYQKAKNNAAPQKASWKNSVFSISEKHRKREKKKTSWLYSLQTGHTNSKIKKKKIVKTFSFRWSILISLLLTGQKFSYLLKFSFIIPKLGQHFWHICALKL